MEYKVLKDVKLNDSNHRSFQAKKGEVVNIMHGWYADSLINSGIIGPIENKAKSLPAETPEKRSNDDLAAIGGVGPKTVEKLNLAGVFTFSQLVNADIETLSNETGINGYLLKRAQNESRKRI